MGGARLGSVVEVKEESGRWPYLKNTAAAGRRGGFHGDLRNFGPVRGAGRHPFASW